MSIINAARRAALPASAFAGPDGTYPVPDKGHAIVAKSFASRAVKKGTMPVAEEERIDAKANKVIKRTRK